MHSLGARDDLLAPHEDVIAAAVLGVLGVGHGVERPHLPNQHNDRHPGFVLVYETLPWRWCTRVMHQHLLSRGRDLHHLLSFNGANTSQQQQASVGAGTETPLCQLGEGGSPQEGTGTGCRSLCGASP